jgi:hypothetical protein
MHKRVSRTLAQPRMSTTRSIAYVMAAFSFFGCRGMRSQPFSSEPTALSGAGAAAPESWPNVAWLDNGCTGALLAPDLVVFAAHCGIGASSAWFGDALDIDIDIDAGTAIPIAQPNNISVTTTRCETFPNWQIGSGTDVAFCLLASPVVEQRLISPPLTGCLHDVLTDGLTVTLVGFGRSGSSDSPGVKRAVQVPIADVGLELAIGDAEHGTCAGDSGSPAFVPLGADGDNWHLAGVLSSGLEGDGCGIGFYEDLSLLLPWLEHASQRDVTPCFTSDGLLTGAPCSKPALDPRGEPTGDSMTVTYNCPLSPSAHSHHVVGCALCPTWEVETGALTGFAPIGIVGICCLRHMRRTRERSRRARGGPRLRGRTVD